jgi:hypothetical protein
MKRVRYTQEQREWAIEQMMPPLNRAVTELARVTGITTVTLRTWQNIARAEGKIVPGHGKQADRWSSTDKFRIVLEAAPLSEVELAAYCRRKGVYPEQIAQWRQACEQANMPAALFATQPAGSAKPIAPDPAQVKRIAELERAIRKKDKALAEAAALLELQKKAAAIWGKDKEE